MKIVGVDEAGRGCIIGPLVICALAVDGHLDTKLKEIKVRDSKLLSASQREKLAGILRQFAEIRVVKITADELNRLMVGKSLNEIEAEFVAKLLSEFEFKDFSAFVDSPDPIPSKFEGRIRSYFKGGGKLFCENKCDLNHAVCSAASIIAKVERDAELKKIKDLFGVDFGSGYTHDELTIRFLKENLRNEKLLPFIRTRWKTWDNLLEADKAKSSKQHKLEDF